MLTYAEACQVASYCRRVIQWSVAANQTVCADVLREWERQTVLQAERCGRTASWQGNKTDVFMYLRLWILCWNLVVIISEILFRMKKNQNKGVRWARHVAQIWMEKISRENWQETLKKRDDAEDFVVDWTILLKWVFNKENGRAGIVLVSLRTGKSGGQLWNFGFSRIPNTLPY